MNIANSLSMVRIIMIFPVLWLYFADLRVPALIVFLAAALTDVLDGWMARKFHQETVFGKNLDAIADKILMLAIFLAFFLKKEIPGWGFLVFARDAGVILKAIALSIGYGTRAVRLTVPTVFGKYTTFLGVLTASLLFLNFPVTNLLKITVTFSIISGLEYLFRKQPDAP